MTSEQRSGFAPTQRGHLPVNGLQMYYEIHGGGGGVPLVLLHGGGSTIDVTYGRLLPWFARHRRVIAVVILPGGHGDYLGELLAPAPGSRYAELTAWLIEQFLDGPV